MSREAGHLGGRLVPYDRAVSDRKRLSPEPVHGAGGPSTSGVTRPLGRRAPWSGLADTHNGATEAAWEVLRRWRDEPVRFAKFALVGLSGVAVNLVVFDAALTLGAVTFVASVVAFLVATSWNFTWNWRWTFAPLRSAHPAQHFAIYFGFAALSLGVNEAVLAAGLAWGYAPLLAQAAGIVAGSVIGFVGNRTLNFRGTSTPAVAPDG